VGAVTRYSSEVIYESQCSLVVRGLTGAHVGLLEAAVDFARWLRKLTVQRYVDNGAIKRPVDPVDRSGNDYHHAVGPGRDSAASFGSVDEPEWLDELDAAAAGFERDSSQVVLPP
jgi:hypothetical protein